MPAERTTVLFNVATPGLLRRSIRAYAKTLEELVADDGPFCCLITSDQELRRLNREFRKKDYTTDVLSFPGASRRVGTPQTKSLRHIGEIAISFPRAKAQASEFRHSVSNEIEILMLHGVLHLLGFDHESDHGQMARAERKWRASLGLPNGLIERMRA
jgi:probable rRNA maturation factor